MAETSHNSTAGHYTAAWNSLAAGMTEDGIRWNINHRGSMVRYEEWSDNIIDMMNDGADVTIEFILKEWGAAAVQSMIWPWSSTFGKVDRTGIFAVDGGFAKSLVLTASTNSPAATDGPAVITFAKTILDPDIAVSINLDNRPRLIPIRLRTFLNDVDGSATVDARYWQIS